MKGNAFRRIVQSIRINPLLFVTAVGLLATDHSNILWVGLLAAALHEIGHIAAAVLLKIPLRKMRLDFLGASLFVKGRLLSYGEEWLLAVSGPLMSFLTSAVGFLFAGQTARLFSCASLLLGLINLLPVRNLDGGRMLSAFLSVSVPPETAEKILSVFSFLTLFLLWVSATYLLLRGGNGISLFCFSIGLFARFLEDAAREVKVS